jgi:hypothetical protein
MKTLQKAQSGGDYYAIRSRLDRKQIKLNVCERASNRKNLAFFLLRMHAVCSGTTGSWGLSQEGVGAYDVRAAFFVDSVMPHSGRHSGEDRMSPTDC